MINNHTSLLIANTTQNKKKKKRPSVTFDLSHITDTSEDPQQLSCSSSSSGSNEYDDFLLSPPHVIDIHGQLIPDTMLVSLFDRPQEMKELVQHNSGFFNQFSLAAASSWSQFEHDVLYADRTKFTDQQWMAIISKTFSSVPSLLEKFKELVGYLGGEEEEEKEEEEEESYSHVDLSRIRQRKQCLTEEAYPQFYINCKKELGNNYQYFLEILFSDELSDDVWKFKIEELLPSNLLQQLQEIVAYETEQEY
ncbi:uncharacterized protein BX663DRAFT_499457 [Cokeromyces recurvatus]|uniref:uncharacterized protein n=1 Tax=Cokeromyces recurvatus TaxID=90255 RepID=UPI0022211868|nr:uncharacterized protein BX663DRAFT_499457 [Cokeromyces recurvatus]KAI7905357.1 hypothetical protein BX663DRAFT_499457 [Cokeromyces recurvatus]